MVVKHIPGFQNKVYCTLLKFILQYLCKYISCILMNALNYIVLNEMDIYTSMNTKSNKKLYKIL